MHVLVTGGTGLLGQVVCRKLKERGHLPVVLDVRAAGSKEDISVVGDVLDLSTLVLTLRRYQIQHVLHLAGMLTPAVTASPWQGIRVNYDGTVTMLEAARLEGVRRVVITSSRTVYDHGAVPGRPTRETDPVFPRSVYATTKLAAEWTGQNYAGLYGLEFAALRLASLFGTGGSQSGVAGRWLDPLIRTLVRDGKASVVRPTRSAVEYVYVEDAGQALVDALSADRLEHAVYNVGEGRLTLFDTILDTLRELLPGSQIAVQADVREASPYREATDPMDLERAQRDFGYRPRFPMPRALADYVQHVQESLAL